MVAGLGGREPIFVEGGVSIAAGGDRTIDALRIRHIARRAPADALDSLETLEARRTSFIAGEIWRTAAWHEMAFRLVAIVGLACSFSVGQPTSIPWR